MGASVREEAGIHEVVGKIDSRYSNHDLAPTKIADRKWATKDIAALLKSPHPDARAYAAEAVGALRHKAAANDLAGLLRDGHPDVRGRALEALRALEAKEFAKDVEHLREDKAVAEIADEGAKGWARVEIRELAERALKAWAPAPSENGSGPR